jgi:hypothetical protein
MGIFLADTKVKASHAVDKFETLRTIQECRCITIVHKSKTETENSDSVHEQI